jgi:inner membrane protein
MPTIMTHAVVGLGVAEVFATRPMPPLFWGCAAALAMLPDLDVLAFAAGIPYGSRFGHRGFSHSLCCALVTSLAVALLASTSVAVPWWVLWSCFFVAMASHGILDAFTNGGLGVAFFSPFDPTRYFFPWRPVQVSPIGRAFFGRWGLRAFLSEVVWIWFPLAAFVALVLLLRRAG